MDDIPDDDGYDSGRGDCPGIDPFGDDSDEEMDTEADDDDEEDAPEEEDPSRDDGEDEEPEGRAAEPLADDDDAEEEDPSEDGEDDDRHTEEAPAEIEPVDVPVEPVPAEVPHELVPVDAPLEVLPVEAPAEPVPAEAPAGDEIIWIDIEMDPRSVAPEPPISPISLGSPVALGSPVLQMISDDDWEWETPPVTPPEPFIYEADSEPDVPSPPPLPTSPPPLTPPPPPPVPMITVFEHDIIVAQHTAEMAVAHARIEDLRMQLDAEVQERLQAQRRQRWSDFRVQRALGSVHRIERRALDRLHSVRRHRSRRHFRRAAARVISRSMRRIRRTIRGD